MVKSSESACKQLMWFISGLLSEDSLYYRIKGTAFYGTLGHGVKRIASSRINKRKIHLFNHVTYFGIPKLNKIESDTIELWRAKVNYLGGGDPDDVVRIRMTLTRVADNRP